MKTDWIARHDRAMRRINHDIQTLQLKRIAARTREQALAPLFDKRLQLERDLVARQWSHAIPALDFLHAIGCTNHEAALALGTSERRVLRWRERADVPLGRHREACDMVSGIAESSRALGKVLGALHRYPDDYVLRRWYGQAHVLLGERTPLKLLLSRDWAAVSWVVCVTLEVLAGGTGHGDVVRQPSHRMSLFRPADQGKRPRR